MHDGSQKPNLRRKKQPGLKGLIVAVGLQVMTEIVPAGAHSKS